VAKVAKCGNHNIGPRIPPPFILRRKFRESHLVPIFRLIVVVVIGTIVVHVVVVVFVSIVKLLIDDRVCNA
jgi:hypothetical protein